jgi:hypothetical protein
MKLILFLVSIYSLIFYQHYKLEKTRAAVAVSKTYSNKQLLARRGFPGKYNASISNLFIWEAATGIRESMAVEFAVRK